MEILKAVISSVQSEIDLASFEMNMILNDQTQPDAISKFKKALAAHSKAKSQMQILDSIREQIQQNIEKNNESKNNSTTDSD